MKCSRAILMLIVLLAGASALGQQSNTFKAKKSSPEKPPRSTVVGPINGKGSSAANANAKQLQNIEHESGKLPAGSQTAGQKSGKAVALKPVQDKPNPPINFSGKTGGKPAGTVNQGANPYAGRLKEKSQ